MYDLFRKDVVEKQSQRHLGDVFLSSPLSFWAITFLLATLIIGLICVALFGEYSRKERVSGVLQPNLGLVRITPTQQGYFQNIYVSTGEKVEVGDNLISIKDDRSLAEGGALSDAVIFQIEDEKANLEQQIQTIPREYRLKRDRLVRRQRELGLEAGRYQEQINIQRRTVELDEQIFRRMKPFINDGSVSLVELSAAENKYLVSKQTLNDLNNRRAKLLAEIGDLEAQIALLPFEQSQAEASIKNRLSELERSRLQTDVSGSSVVRAPIAGTIATIIAKKGQLASPQKSVLAILPEGGELQAELYVPTRAIGFVKEGQTVRLLYDAYPYQKFGYYEGEIIDVSKSVILGTELDLPRPVAEPVFIVTVRLNEQTVTAFGEELALQAGMSLSADLILEDRKIWEWVFQPLLGRIGR